MSTNILHSYISQGNLGCIPYINYNYIIFVKRYYDLNIIIISHKFCDMYVKICFGPLQSQ